AWTAPAAITPIRRCVSATVHVQYLLKQSACASANGATARQTPHQCTRPRARTYKECFEYRSHHGYLNEPGGKLIHPAGYYDRNKEESHVTNGQSPLSDVWHTGPGRAGFLRHLWNRPFACRGSQPVRRAAAAELASGTADVPLPTI